ncbi:MAG: SDR family oxidoreductase, partial [Ignavibacteria bacterium]|nr:SDR family oxidoreductase [Ignavibacteria bacterium]
NVKNYPMKRFGESSDVKSLLKFLFNENSYITGHNFVVDGGKIL